MTLMGGDARQTKKNSTLPCLARAKWHSDNTPDGAFGDNLIIDKQHITMVCRLIDDLAKNRCGIWFDLLQNLIR
jgi:hypothetical protein